MPESTKYAFNYDEASAKVREAVELAQEKSRTVALNGLEAIERYVGSFTELEVKAAAATNQPKVIELVDAATEWQRETAKTGVESVRNLLAA
jgi:hypothetical protein